MAYFWKSRNKQLVTGINRIVGVGALLTAGWLLLPMDLPGRPFAAILALMIWPSLAWAGFDYFWQTEKWRFESIILSAAGGVALLLVSVLGLTISTGAIPLMLLVSLPTFLSLLPILIDAFQAKKTDNPSHQIKTDWLWFLLPLGIALLLRLPWFGYREIQGDEGVVLVRAADALLGDRVELLLHRKGPMEILLAMGVWGLAGKTNDFWIRLPFLLCNLLSLGMFYRLSDHWFGRRAAVLASCLLAIVGFHVAFSRVVQYQSLVMMWGIGAVLAAERYRQTGRTWELVLAAVLLAAGLLSHYDAILYTPAILTLLACRWLIERRVPVAQLGWSVGIGLVMLGTFYIPFAFGPDFQNTLGYLLNERVDTSAGGSLADVWQMVSFYNSSWAIVGFGGFALMGFYALWHKDNMGMVKLSAALFFIVPLLFYTMIVSVPRTHVYTFFPGLVLLSAIGIERIAEFRRLTLWLYRLGRIGFSVWFVVCASYIWLLFTWGPGEVQRNWQSRRPNPILYWTTWETPPAFGLFGFPYQAGWRELGQSEMEGLVYASNEEEEITNWYMGQAPRTHCDTADPFFLANNVQDTVAFDPALISDKEETKVSQNLTIFRSDDVDVQLGSRMVTPAEISKPLFGGQHAVDVALGERVTLAGYDLIFENNRIQVVLYWVANDYLNRNFQAFVHAIDQDGNLIIQHDSAPECGINPTTRWEPGTVIRDPHTINLAADWPADRPLRLMAGMYDLITQERMSVAGEPGNFVFLGEIQLEDDPIVEK
ncbi:MAG: hypothetical protein ACI9EW_000455 [Cellvibrionaceae bacterium]